MLTQEDDVDAHALHRRGWTISAIARHLGHDRKTIRSYVNGERTAGVRAPAGEDRFGPFVDYCRARLVEDPHLWAETLLDELRLLGFEQSYSTLTRQLRLRQLRPHCEACSAAKGRPVAIIEHPSGEETQWDWLDLPAPPAADDKAGLLQDRQVLGHGDAGHAPPGGEGEQGLAIVDEEGVEQVPAGRIGECSEDVLHPRSQ